MKNYTITVNGTAYDVTVEEGGAGDTGSTAPKKSVAKPAAPAAAPKPAAPAGAQGAVKVNAPMPGKILSVKVQAGDAVKKGDIIMILEAMKMKFQHHRMERLQVLMQTLEALWKQGMYLLH